MQLRGKFKVLGIIKSTSAVFFRELKIGDEFELVYDLSGGYKSAPTIAIYKNNQIVHSNNALQLSNNLNNFELEQL